MLCFSALSLAKYALLPILRAFAKNYLTVTHMVLGSIGILPGFLSSNRSCG